MHKFPDIHQKTPEYIFDLDMVRFDRQFDKAQFKLDSMIMTHMIPFMPMVTGNFINLTKARSASVAGTGYVYAAAPPYGRFLYMGKVMVSPSTGSTWAKKDEEKVLVSQYGGKTRAKENLTYTKTFHPEVSARWFETAKTRYGHSWARITKRIAGGG